MKDQKFVKNAAKTSWKKRISIGVAALTKASLVVKCGGAAAKRKRRQEAASSLSI